MFGFFKKRAEVLNHWIAFAHHFQTSPLEFYQSVEKELSARKVPRMEISQMEVAEGGLLSEKRIYLRMLRERIVFDICAAPFGNGFFFSCRTAEIPIVLRLWQLIALIGLFFFGIWSFVKLFGFTLGLLLLLSAILAVGYLLRNLVAIGLQDLDKVLLHSPVFGSFYQVFFRKETYHRIDSRLCYLHLVPMVIKQLAEEATAEKGIQLVEQFELSPVLGELYKPAARAPRRTEIPPILPPARVSI